MPAEVANAVCGPQMPSKQRPASGVSLASLNPCPLSACCNKYGQCGINQDFCTEFKSATGAPGISAPTRTAASPTAAPTSSSAMPRPSTSELATSRYIE
ncbi:hypothetical protein N7495_007438 [Penicillium taxi]|uniref:uncharacterized protein n=1 Tax=Penicillium taxi TaxID=168475 RepID=UPI0025459FC3|nr:uncharacterized protein N7495_007438 [Penicillium taxi]KAJ5887397.1 hypothetical protein N7495_007438 [Penicillium taxi]